MPLRLAAPAKVNLRLRILAREASGFHGLETLFCALSLHDTVEVAEGEPGIRLAVDGEVDTGPPERNLVARAAEHFFREIGEPPAVDLRLAKRIPAAAGLGGGSSDAAATLRALNALRREPVGPRRLLELGAELGSDVPFFLGGSPYALAWSRGERLLSLPPLPPRPVLVAHPGEAMPTANAFGRLAELRGGGHRPAARSLELDALLDWDRLAALAGNDFEPVALERLPRLRGGLDALRGAGASIALLAGSGASLFGVFPDPAARDAAARPLRDLGFSTFPAETLTAFPAPE